jgi:hypothetical protein
MSAMRAYLPMMTTGACLLGILTPALAEPPEKTAACKTAPAEAADPELVKLVEKDAKVLEPLLKEDWVVEVKGHEIVLTSKFEVFRESLTRTLWDEMPEFSDAVSREELLTHGSRGSMCSAWNTPAR